MLLLSFTLNTPLELGPLSTPRKGQGGVGLQIVPSHYPFDVSQCYGRDLAERTVTA